MLRRDHWMNLNGRWDFALDPEGRWQVPGQVSWNKTIVVPFAPETTRSGIGDTGFYRACWYRRSFERPEHSPGERLILHFGAVDYAASVWVNGARCVHHEGGYTPFKVDITDLLTPTGVQEVVVLAEDDPADLAQPRGKQDWQLEPHSIWYPRTTGIWQTVWLERAPAVRVEALRWTPNLAGWEIGLEADILDGDRTDLQLAVRLTAGSTVLADDVYSVVGGEVFRRIALSDPGIDDFRNELLWAPHSPTLIGAEVELRDSKGQLIDEVKSYTALRSISAQGDRFVLNGRPYPMRLVLDQGYWPDTGITAPDDASLRLDVELARNMGFNGVRKHQKIEDPRYLYWADKLGLLVWEEMPSAYRFTRGSVQRLVREWTEVIDRDYSHPCIVAWVPFNESWGVPNLPNSASERHYVQSLFHLTKTLDPMRLVVGNDGWESVATDLIGIHDYEGDPEQLALRYHSEESRPQLFRRERPGGRVIVFDDRGHADHPIILSEFGGIAVSADHPEQWGYSRCRDTQELAQRYKALLEVVRKLSIFTGFCYTQFADTYQEANGLLYADRTPKFPLDEIAAATRGKRFFSDISMPPAPRRKPLPPPSTPDTEG